MTTKLFSKTRWILALGASMSLLASCGGGGGSDGNPPPPLDTTLIVDAVDPDDGESLATFPSEISIDFNRDLLLSSVDVSQFAIFASGGDGSFGDGNEVEVAIDDAVANGSNVTLDVSTASAGADDDTYQLTIESQDPSAISDLDGELLDGDADDAEGGDFVSTFIVETPPPATLSLVQSSVFTPNCATSGCHDAASASSGLVLADGQAFAELVNVDAQQDTTLGLNRIEPNNPDASYLVRKLEGAAGITGLQMPRNSPPLSDTLIQLVRDWVSDGAQDN